MRRGYPSAGWRGRVSRVLLFIAAGGSRRSGQGLRRYVDARGGLRLTTPWVRAKSSRRASMPAHAARPLRQQRKSCSKRIWWWRCSFDVSSVTAETRFNRSRRSGDEFIARWRAVLVPRTGNTGGRRRPVLHGSRHHGQPPPPTKYRTRRRKYVAAGVVVRRSNRHQTGGPPGQLESTHPSRSMQGR